MRTFVLLLLFTMPPLVACGAAYAKTTAEIGKPVCTRYDDATKPEQPATSAGVAPASSTATTSPAVATTAPSTANAGSASAKPKSGGTSGMMRPHDALRWQTFLPGMFK
jgi:type IV secretory pathway TrbL component